jgi:hypothetical protein
MHGLPVDEASYKKNVSQLTQKNSHYTLHSFVYNGIWRPADNCNSTVERAILGHDIFATQTHDQFCQQAAVNIVMQLVCSIDYQKAVDCLEILSGSEPTDITEEMYQPSPLL